MKNICKIHPLTYFFILIFILLGYFKFYLNFMLIIIVHETGHIIFSYILKWQIKQIVILPMGALIKFEDNLNKPIIEEFIIAIMGVIFQSLFIFFFHSEISLLCYKIILFFNLLPIYPLDGAKIINLLLNQLTNFKTSYIISLMISYVTLIFLLALSFIKLSLFSILTLIPLLIQVLSLINNRKKVYIKFLLERYLYTFNFKKYKYISSISKMKRDYKHYFVINNKIVSEKVVLSKLFE